ncbi:MAG: tetratricopeptide repeat protein [Gemmataceae bacterium]|nr:tetratricopeptide repeat protein [Gemmataceae bacterium]MCI0737656.1 tetratricopeptide repeat protein [Gemmataceae bacterium]
MMHTSSTNIWFALALSMLFSQPASAQENTWQQNNDVGWQHFQEGRYVEADRFMTAALKQAESFGDGRLFQTLNRLSLIRHQLGKNDEAIDLGKRALSGAEGLADPVAVSDSLNNLGMILWSKGRTQEAEPYLRRALETLERVKAKDHEARMAKTVNNIGGLYFNKGRWKEAGEHWQRALALHEKIQMRDPLACNTLGNIAQWHWARGERDKSWEFFRRALEHVEKLLNKEHPLYGGLINLTGYNYLEEGKLDEAAAAFEQAMAIFQKRKLSAAQPMVADCLRNLGELHRLRKQYAEGEQRFRESLAGWEKSVLKVPREAKTHFKLAMLYADQKRWKEAEAGFQKSLEVYDKAIGAAHPDIAEVLEQYALSLQETGRRGEAREMQARAKNMRAEHARANGLD